MLGILMFCTQGMERVEEMGYDMTVYGWSLKTVRLLTHAVLCMCVSQHGGPFWGKIRANFVFGGAQVPCRGAGPPGSLEYYIFEVSMSVLISDMFWAKDVWFNDKYHSFYP